jgi:hypothetical protein
MPSKTPRPPSAEVALNPLASAVGGAQEAIAEEKIFPSKIFRAIPSIEYGLTQGVIRLIGF